MNELWRKPDYVEINDFDSSMFPYLMNYQVTNESKLDVEKARKEYFDVVTSTDLPLTEQECQLLREKLGAAFVTETYSKAALRAMLVEKKGKRKDARSREEEE
jgi:hypothetical protein